MRLSEKLSWGNGSEAVVLSPAYSEDGAALSSLMPQYNTGTTNIVRNSISIPPKVGMAIGTMMSAPRPVDVSTGSSARMVVAVVMRHGRILCMAASLVACLMLS